MRATIVPVVISSILAAIAVIIFAQPLASLLIDGRAAHTVNSAAVASALRALAGALPFAALTDTLLGAARGYHEMRPTVIIDRIGRSSLQTLGVLAAALSASSALLAPAWALPYVGASITALFWLRHIMRKHKSKPTAAAPNPRPATSPHPAPSPRTPAAAAGPAIADNRHGKPNAKGFWSFTGPRSLASIAQIVIQRLDIVLVGVLIGPVQAAIYTAATRFLVAGQLGNAAISMAAQPQFTKLFAVGDRDGANAVYQATTAWLILLTWPLYLLAVIFGPYVLVIFGHAYHAGSTVMLILGLAMLVATACGQVDMVLITTGRSSWSLYNGLLAMVINVGVDLILIPKVGITGAAIGWAAAIGITNLVPLVQVATAAKVHPFGRGSLAAVLLATFSFAAIPLTVRALAGNGGPQVIASLAAGGLVMALGLWLLRGPLQLAVLPLPKALRRLQGRPQINSSTAASVRLLERHQGGSGAVGYWPTPREEGRLVISFDQNRSLLTGYSPSSDKGVNSGVIKYLVALIWPIGLAIIAAAAFLGSRRYATSEVEVSSAPGRSSPATRCRATGPASPTLPGSRPGSAPSPSSARSSFSA